MNCEEALRGAKASPFVMAAKSDVWAQDHTSRDDVIICDGEAFLVARQGEVLSLPIVVLPIADILGNWQLVRVDLTPGDRGA